MLIKKPLIRLRNCSLVKHFSELLQWGFQVLPITCCIYFLETSHNSVHTNERYSLFTVGQKPVENSRAAGNGSHGSSSGLVNAVYLGSSSPSCSGTQAKVISSRKNSLIQCLSHQAPNLYYALWLFFLMVSWSLISRTDCKCLLKLLIYKSVF